MSEELKPCPFCGATPDISDTDMLIGDEDGDWARLWCEECTASGPAIKTNGRPAEDCVDDAIAAWNRRTETPQLDWNKAIAHLAFYEKAYSDLPDGAGRFGLAVTIMPLMDRLERGERSKWLYDEIMEVE